MFAIASVLLATACENPDTLAPRAPRMLDAPGALRASAAVAGAGPLLSGVRANVCADVAGGTGAAPGPGAPLQAFTCHGGANQQFALQPSGQITAYGGARCLDVWGAVANDGDPVVAWTCHGGSNQRWTRTAAGELRSAVNGKCLDLWGAQGQDGARLVVWSCHGGANQKWTLTDPGAPSVTLPAPAPTKPVDSAIAPVFAPRPITAGATANVGVAELPRVLLDTRAPAPTGRTIDVAVGGDLQAALDAAQPGDVVVLPAGATYVGNFVLRPKAGMTAGQWITVRTAGQLPAEGTRVGPADAAQMPKLLTPNFGAAVQTAAHAQGWRLTGLEIGLAPSTTSATALVLFGSGGADQNTLAQVPSRLVLDRSYVHAPPAGDVRRCIALNSASTAVIDSHVSECHSHNGDSQAIVGWNGPGPFKIANNRLEGAHEVIVLGGADPSVPGLVPGDVEIRRNHVTRPLSWKGVWGVKNLVEFKAGQRVLLEANVFENSWADGQSYAFMFWSANADGHALWSITQDVTFRYNVVRNVADGFNLADRYNASLPRARRITIAHNVLTGLGAQGGGGRLVLVLGQLEGVTVANNTGFGGASDVLFGTTDQPIPSFVFRDNVTGGHSTLQSGMGNGVLAMQALQIPATSVRGNVFAAGKGPGAVPAGNAYAPSQSAVGFVDLAGGNLALSAASPFRTSSTGGSTPGADVAMVRQLTAGVVR
jgi:hypothetical protein